MLTGRHLCNFSPVYGDWRINGKEYILKLKNIEPFLLKDQLKVINFNDIGHKGKHMDNYLDVKRYHDCDINYPGILTIAENPYNCKYRMIDGRHRILKMTNMDMKKSVFYIIDYDLFFKHLEEVVTC